MSHRSLLLLTILVTLFCRTALSAELTAADARSLSDAQTALNNSNHQRAVELLLSLRAKYPTLGEIPRLLTHAYHALGQTDKARETALAAISVGRLTSDVLVRLAQIDQQRDDRLALLNTVRLLTIVEADDYQWRLIYGDLLADSGQLEESRGVFQSLVDERPESADLYLRLGDIATRLGDPEAAATNLETAWNLGADNTRLARTIAGLQQQLGNDIAAVAWIERAVAASPSSDEKLQLEHAQLCWNAEQTERAAAAARPLINSPTDEIAAQAHVLLGRIAMGNQEVDAAISHWREATARGVDSPQLLAVIGADYFNKGDFNRAAAVLKRVVDGAEAAEEQHLRFLVTSLIRAADLSNARTYLRHYVEQFGMSDAAKQLVRLYVATESA